MRFFLAIGMITLLMLLFLGAGSADQVTAAPDQADSRWSGAWESSYYSMHFIQNGSMITGTYEPKNLSLCDPGRLQGTMSADGKTISGIWFETGPLDMVLSGDGMSFTGTGGVRPREEMNQSDWYSTQAIRVLPSFDPVNIWNGSWKSYRSITNLVQDGMNVNGSYIPLSGIDDEPGTFDGVVSDNGRILNGTWNESGKFTFTQSENGMFFNGTYSTTLDLDALTDSWDGIKIS